MLWRGRQSGPIDFIDDADALEADARRTEKKPPYVSFEDCSGKGRRVGVLMLSDMAMYTLSTH
jgi:hypothetical protein